MWLLTLIMFLAGCSGLGILGASKPVTWYALQDKRTTPMISKRPGLPRIDHILMIGPVDSNAFFDSTQVAYSRSDIARAYYQFAAWTDRPAKRLASLVENRLAKRARFLSVVGSTDGVRGTLLLTLTLEEIFHDAATAPPVGKLRIRARLVDWQKRILIAERIFDHQAKVSKANADGAVRALSIATTAFLDSLTRWVETAARPADTKGSD